MRFGRAFLAGFVSGINAFMALLDRVLNGNGASA